MNETHPKLAAVQRIASAMESGAALQDDMRGHGTPLAAALRAYARAISAALNGDDCMSDCRPLLPMNVSEDAGDK